MIGKAISHYTVLENLGEGGMAVVYKARDSKLDRDVALKFLPPELTRDREAKERFIHEAKAASALDHPNICTIHEIGETDDGQMFMVMPCYEGETLKERMDAGAHGRAPLPINDCLDIAVQIAQGLAKAHEKGIVHRDIKPANIFITKDGVVKILDFGLAKLHGQTKLTKTGTTLGTVSYMSPEQARGQQVDHRTDIWSLGVVLYEMLTGQLPFKGEYEQAVIYSILNEEPEPIILADSPSMRETTAIINNALAKSVVERYPSIKEMLNGLKRVSGDKIEKSIAFATKSRNRKKRRVTYAIAASVIVIGIVGGFFTFDFSLKKTPLWLRRDAPLKSLTSESGGEQGRISPDGRYLVYDPDGIIKLKILSSGDTKIISSSEPGAFCMPSWSPDGENVAFVAWKVPGKDEIVTSSLLGIIRQHIISKETPFHPKWSPDGQYLAYLSLSLKTNTNSIVLLRPDGTTAGVYPVNPMIYEYTWGPDSRHIAFFEHNEKIQAATIRILDTSTGSISDTLKGARSPEGSWRSSGLAWSPDGSYLVYVGQEGKNRELFALPMNPKTNAPRGISVRVTRLDGIGNPCWLTFTKDGQQLSFGIGYSNRDVYCMNLDIGASTISGELTPVATDRYFDGEACWMPDGKSVVFASERGGRGKSDLYRYYIETRETERLTFSETWKSNPRISPNGNALGYFSDGGVWAMPPTGGPAERMTPRTLKLADNPAYAWSADGRTLFLTIPDSAGPYLCTLAELNLTDGSVRKHLSGLAGPDFVLSPKGDQLAISGIPISPNDFSSEKIGVLNLETGRLKILQMQLSLSPRGRLSWSGDGKYILHDRSAPNNETVYELLPVNGGPPRELKMDLGGLNGYGLVDQIDPWGKSVLVSVYSNEMDMWMLGGRKE